MTILQVTFNFDMHTNSLVFSEDQFKSRPYLVSF